MGKKIHSKAFALPTVLIAAVVLFIPLLAAFATISSIDVALTNQYTEKIMKEASQSGLTMAQACMAANNGSISWTDAKPLKPNTDCTGTEKFSCPANSTTDGCYVLKNETYRTMFKVGVTTDASNNPTGVTSQGIFRQVRKTSGEVVVQKVEVVKMKSVAIGGETPQIDDSAYLKTYLGNKPRDGNSPGVYVNAACAIADGSTYCWWAPSSGSPSATLVGGNLAGKTVTQLSISGAQEGYYGTNRQDICAVAGGSVYCWSQGSAVGNASLGTSYSSTPTLVGGGLTGKTAGPPASSPSTPNQFYTY